MLRCVYNKQVPLYDNYDYGLTLSNRRLQDIAILIFKAVNGMLPEYKRLVYRAKLCEKLRRHQQARRPT